MPSAFAIVVMGVSGCGKSTVGMMLADRIQCDFLEGDSLHPAKNVAKMSSGTPLTDGDRLPWLLAIHDIIREHLSKGQSLVVSCSALKPTYRNLLAHGTADPPPPPPPSRADGPAWAAAPPANPDAPSDRPLRLGFVLLEPDEAELRRRVTERERAGGHFFRASLLSSQLATLEYREEDLLAHFRSGDIGGTQCNDKLDKERGGPGGRGNEGTEGGGEGDDGSSSRRRAGACGSEQVGGGGLTRVVHHGDAGGDAAAGRCVGHSGADVGGSGVRAPAVFPDPEWIVDRVVARLAAAGWWVSEPPGRTG